MSNLSVDSNPQGRPRVYFCCHPGDFEAFFGLIKQEIQSTSNCAFFWYDGEPGEDWELELSQMQLFVMPVTRRLLTDANRALDVEFPFAMEQHIPVLPLMQENGLETLFNQKCGDLQFLDKNINDATSISYNEKLKKYLELVLIGDETAEKIRNAFDAYIFLSYRKKDRRHAQELMRLIHKNDFCRDIAIWYDEFLTPGENFNDSIQAALEKSKLFALAVTPNLVNEQNYVMTTEFPMARDSQKVILPAVMVETDREELARKYPGIPPCADAHDAQALSGALLRAVQGLAVQTNDGDPMHDYLIGLAYLGGVDVEVDHQKAVELITGAADAGLIEAMEQLVTMYRDGVGVSRNPAAEIGWLERISVQASKNFKETGAFSDGWKIYEATFRRGSVYERIGRLEGAKAAYQLGREVCEELFDKFPYEQMADNYMVICYRLSVVCSQLWEKEEAKLCCSDVIRIGEAVAKDKCAEGDEWQILLAAAYSRMSRYCAEDGDDAGAKDYALRSVTTCKDLVQKHPSPGNRRAWSVRLIETGDAHEKAGRLAEAKDCYQQAHEIRKELAEQLNTPASKRDLALSYERLGSVYAEENDLQQAQQYCAQLYQLRKALYHDQGTMEDQLGFLVCCNVNGDLHRKMNNFEPAKLFYQMALSMADILIYTSDDVTLRTDLVITIKKCIGLLYEIGDAGEIAAFYAQELSQHTRVMEDETLEHVLLSIAIASEEMAKLAKQNRDLPHAKVCHELRLKTVEKLVRQNNAIENRRHAAIASQNLGAVCKEMGLMEEAAEYYYQAVDLAVSVAEEDDSPKNQDMLATISFKAGFVTRELIHFQGAYELFGDLVERFPEEPSYAEKFKKAKAAWERLSG